MAGHFLFQYNADPIYMFQGSRVTPFTLSVALSQNGAGEVGFFLANFPGNDSAKAF